MQTTTFLQELYKVLQQTESDLAKLPQPPSDNPLGDILWALDNFKKEVSEHVEGTPEADGLLQTIQPHTTNFKSKICETAPNFVPWEHIEAHQHAPPQTSFFSNEEEGDSHDGSYHYPAGAADEFWDEVHNAVESNYTPPAAPA